VFSSRYEARTYFETLDSLMTASVLSMRCVLLLVLLSPWFVESSVDPQYVIGVDLGTESARVGLFSVTGEMVETAAVPYPTTFPNVGWAEQNPEDWWRCLGEACRKVTTTAYKKGINQKEIKGLCVDTTACSVVMLDDKNIPLRNCLLWCDARSAPQCEEILRKAKGDPALQV
jgi:sugar (pentulose or hexulose) kinase